MRNVFIRRTSEPGAERPWAQGVVDLTDAEQLAFIRAGGSQTARVTGIINGLPKEAVAKLNVGDNLAVADDCLVVSLSAGSYEDGATHEKRATVNVALRLSGKVSRTAAPVAQVDW